MIGKMKLLLLFIPLFIFEIMFINEYNILMGFLLIVPTVIYMDYMFKQYESKK